MNYFNYFTEIEERFQQRRGSLLMLSTLDWALIETWREAGVPLEAALRGIDAAFDKQAAQSQRSTRRPRKVNGLAWCAQAVLEAVEQSRDAAIGAAPDSSDKPRDSGFEVARIRRYLERNAGLLTEAAANIASPANSISIEAAARLRELAAALPLLSSHSEAEGSASPSLEARTVNLEELDRTLTVLEEKLFAALLTAVPEDRLVALREQAARELAPYRGKMQAVQIKQVQQQFLQKRLLDAHALPRLSLFYMPHEEKV
jgi:hypothetical protein